MGDLPAPPVTMVFPEVLYNLLLAIDAVTQEQIDAAAGKLPSTRADDIEKGEVEPFVQKLYVLGTQKAEESEKAEKAGREEEDQRACTIIGTVYSLINLLVSSVLTAGELCDNRYEAKICKNYILVLRAKAPAAEVEFEDEDEPGEEDEDERPSSVPPKNRQH